MSSAARGAKSRRREGKTRPVSGDSLPATTEPTDGLIHCEQFNCRLSATACVKRRKAKDLLGNMAFPECVKCGQAPTPLPPEPATVPLPELHLVESAAASLELATFHLLLSLSRLGAMLRADEEQRSAASQILEHFLGLPLDEGAARVAGRLAAADPLLLAAVSTNLPGLFRVDARVVEDLVLMQDVDRELARRLRLEKDHRLKLLQVLLQRRQPR